MQKKKQNMNNDKKMQKNDPEIEKNRNSANINFKPIHQDQNYMLIKIPVIKIREKLFLRKLMKDSRNYWKKDKLDCLWLMICQL